MSEKERMLTGELYDASDPELTAARAQARELLARFNAQPGRAVLEELLASVGRDATIEPPFHCDYGFNISVGDRFYANVNCVFLDCAPISIGDRVLFGPAVQLYAATHPVDPRRAAAGWNARCRSRSATTSGSAAARSSSRASRSATAP